MATHQGSDLNFDGSFLKDLPSSIERYTYRGESQFFDIFKSEFTQLKASTDASEFSLFHASKETIKAIFNPQTDDTISKCCTSFNINEELFLATMMSNPHSVAIHEMNNAIIEALLPMGLFNCIRGYPRATVEGESRGKATDYGWGPKRTPPGQRISPSVALEVAFSESDAKLNSDVRFWLNPDDGNAKGCLMLPSEGLCHLTLSIERSRPEIRIEIWEKKDNRCHRSQVTWITGKGTPTHVTHHPLIIPLESLFLRQSTRPEEKDLAIPEQRLQIIAETIWEVQG
ncbi:uncharacterized protein N7518_000411 [Penicillium psychrosexuale]|uniref:uncharacterized protein n=1 Tax=Penicillium psychrosexuale TaxID=1002107 RepID=UPI002544D9C0|nr:uncharacterized protein N7518_000411 [Penicillium psychrosexuale]KAJ5804108.1 hypothetical protein N7518_000411 [Penicillium psychrosexuale]